MQCVLKARRWRCFPNNALRLKFVRVTEVNVFEYHQKVREPKAHNVLVHKIIEWGPSCFNFYDHFFSKTIEIFLLRYNWHVTCFRYATYWFNACMNCKIITTLSLALSPHIVTNLFSCDEIYPLNIFHTYHMVVLILVTKLYIISQGLILELEVCTSDHNCNTINKKLEIWYFLKLGQVQFWINAF